MSEACETLDQPVREVTDAAGYTWYVYLVVEGSKYDPRTLKRRSNWLCMETGAERRFMSPVPEGWMHWTDATLRYWIAVAKPDLRGA